MLRLLKLLSLCVLFFVGISIGFFFILRFFSSSSAVFVPAVEGFSVSEARFLAEREKLRLEVKEEKFDTKREAGIVVKQAPLSGMSVKKGQVIYVTVSKGIERITVENLAEMTLDRAQIAIQQSGLVLKGVSYISSALPAQTVVSQSPAGGSVVSKDAECFLLVSQGGKRPLFIMPDIRGKSLTENENVFAEYGIAANIEKKGQSGGDVITRQNPPPGYPVNSSDTVRLGVGE
jgi:eukaryotic-like serine/threonine-protein kinase